MGKTIKDINKKYRAFDFADYKSQRKDRRMARGQKHFQGNIEVCNMLATKRNHKIVIEQD